MKNYTIPTMIMIAGFIIFGLGMMVIRLKNSPIEWEQKMYTNLHPYSTLLIGFGVALLTVGGFFVYKNQISKN